MGNTGLIIRLSTGLLTSCATGCLPTAQLTNKVIEVLNCVVCFPSWSCRWKT